MSFEGPSGTPVKIADFKGKPLLVNLWATWCGPCIAEMPTLDALAGRQAEKLQVIVVSQDMKGREVVDPWWAKQSFKLLKPYIDAKSDLGFAFNTGMVPTTVLYDAQGKEVWRVIGGMNWDGPRANTLMAETLGGLNIPDQSRSNSLIAVFCRVCASTRLTITAQDRLGPGDPSGRGLPGRLPGTTTE